MSEYLIRPHHALCIQFFEGKGYSEEFTENMTRLIDELKRNVSVRIVCKGDILCEKCPHNTADGCESGEKTERYDKAVMKLCGFGEGEVMTADELLGRVYKNIISSGKLSSVCHDCEWACICHKNQNK